MSTALDHALETLTPGQSASLTVVVSEDMVREFARVSGDENPLHVDPEYAATTQFRTPIAHGMLTGALFSRIIGMQLPGKRSLLMKETLEFLEPVFYGDEIEFAVSIEHVSQATRIATLVLTAKRGDTLLTRGSASVLVRE